jgi:LysR family transcriptional regulator of abg operon
MIGELGVGAVPLAVMLLIPETMRPLLTQSDYVGLMPMQIAQHPLAAQFMTVVPIKEGHLPLTLGAIVRRGALLKPALRHFVAHLHRAAVQVG